ncbi:MAG: DUF6230 family protein [Nocardiaceae bacterium]|nr:DUF6230 family protein [Nocardiaceae bacterium]
MITKIKNWSNRGGSALAAQTAEFRTKASAAADTFNANVRHAANTAPSNRTRWGRSSAVIVPSLAVVTGLGAAMTQGALAASFNVADKPMSLAVQSLDAQGLDIVVSSLNVTDTKGNTKPEAILHAAVGSGTLTGVCIIASQSILGGTYSVVLSVPPDAGLANGQNLQFDVTRLVGHNVTLSNALIGKSADLLAVNGVSLNGQPGGFGVDGSEGTAHLENVEGTARGATILGSLQAPTFDASIHPGEVKSC